MSLHARLGAPLQSTSVDPESLAFRRGSLNRGVLVVYLALVIVAALLGAVRLHQSRQMPGLAAIELVLLAMPWSLALGVESLSHLGWSGMAGIVLGGVVLNSWVLRKLAGCVQRGLSAR